MKHATVHDSANTGSHDTAELQTVDGHGLVYVLAIDTERGEALSSCLTDGLTMMLTLTVQCSPEISAMSLMMPLTGEWKW